MLKDYVTKKFPFLQTPGSHGKNRGKREQEVSCQEEGSSGALPAENLAEFDVVEEFRVAAEEIEAALRGPVQQEELVAPPADEPEGEVPGQQAYLAGMCAYQDEDFPTALEAFISAAGEGHSQAQFLCGQMYQQGVGTEKNSGLALSWYKRAAKLGHMDAQMACAACYEAGEGTTMNLKRALSWYEQAAKLGSVPAQLKCGRMYYCGRAETRSPKKARFWLETAAESGNEEAARLLLEHF